MKIVHIKEHPSNEGEQIAFIQTCGVPCLDLSATESEHMNREEFTKIATLFSESPSLLKILELIMASYEKDGHLLNFDVDVARQAINKAKGVSNG